MSFIVLTTAQAVLARKALAKLLGLPRRATVVRNGAQDDALTAQLGAQLDTTDAVDVGENDGTMACFELPPELEKYLGRSVTVAGKSVTLPTADQLANDEGALPATLRAVRQTKRDAPLARANVPAK